MISTPSHNLKALEAALAASKGRIARQRLAKGFCRGIDAALTLLLWCSISIAVYIAFRVVSGMSWKFDPLFAIIPITIALLVILVNIIRERAKSISETSVAERTDAAMENHNRIATAYDLLKRGESSPLAQAAIADGFDAVKKVNRDPLVDPVDWKGKSWLTKIAIVALAWLIVPLAMQLNWKRDKETSEPGQLAAVNNPPTTNPSNLETKPLTPQTPKNNTADNTHPNGSPGVLTTALPPTGQAQAASTAGASGGATAGKSASGDPSTGGESKKQQQASNPENKPNSSKPSTGSGMGGGVQGTSTGSVGAGGKGGGGKALALENESRKQDAAELESGDDAGGDPAEPDENNENRHRGGAQPLLQDRAQSPTRELGIGGLKGAPGTGRGGPTPTKKARGAGALMLGVPIPDFIPGKLLAGTSKMSRETIKPQRNELPPIASHQPAARTADESVIERQEISADDSQALTDYLKALHHDDADRAPATQPSSPAQGALSH